MNRRGFLKMLGMAAPAAVVAPKYFFAPMGGWEQFAEPRTATGYADWVPNAYDPAGLLAAYYFPKIIEQLKSEIPMVSLAKTIPMPAASNRQIKFYAYRPGPEALIV